MTDIVQNGNGLSPETAGAEGTVNNACKTPYIEIIEQPASKALRFRYECEGRSAGSIPGVHNTPENKTYPTIRIVGYKGEALIVVSCVTKDEPFRAHPHNLVGKEGCKDGIYTTKIDNETMTATFSNLGIQCVKKKDIEEALKIREEKRVDPFRQGFAHSQHASSIDLNAVRLCFQAFLTVPGPKKFNVLTPVVSDPIYDKKAMSDLVITKLSHSSATVKGGQEVILLCEKVAKEDIQIRFYEEVNGMLAWEGFGEFTPSQVHKQVGIWFKTPSYRITEIEQKVKVFIQLKRPSDGATSEPLPFFFVQDDSGKLAFWLLRLLNPDYDILANVLADVNHPLSKEILTLQQSTCISANVKFKDMLEEGLNETANNADVENRSRKSSVDSDENDTNDVVDDSINFKNHLNTNLKSEVKTDESNSVRNHIDDLSAVTQDKLKELGFVFTETEEIAVDSPEEKCSEDSSIASIIRTAPENESSADIAAQKSNIENYKLHSSLHMAMKNTIKIPERITFASESNTAIAQYYEPMVAAPPRPVAVKPELKKVSSLDSDPLPPLPPKRVKKNLSLNRSLPALPEKETKLALFRKLFFSKKKKSKTNVKNENDVDDDSQSFRSLSDYPFSMNGIDDSLTEAEHYALYTSVAPRATDSEFDENSCYYSPVEAEPVK